MTRFPARWVVAGFAAAVSLALTLTLTWLGMPNRDDRDLAMLADAPVSRSEKARFSGGPLVESPAVPDKGPSEDVAPPGSPPAASLLREWDRRRARAYARGDVAGLRRLYADGSRASTSDVALLQDYKRRGLRVERLRMQLLAVEVVDHDPGHWRLKVTDRVSSAVAVGARSRVVLPRDTASTRVVTLQRASADATWKVTAVTRP